MSQNSNSTKPHNNAEYADEIQQILDHLAHVWESLDTGEDMPEDVLGMIGKTKETLQQELAVGVRNGFSPQIQVALCKAAIDKFLV